MIIAFVSLMKVFPWGGSEELWLRTAKLALDEGHQVYSITQKWENTPHKIENLRESGANTLFYQVPSYTLKERIQIKLHLKEREFIDFPSITPDIYVISSGTVFDIWYSQVAIEKVLATGKPYLIINQHNYEFGFIPIEKQRPYFINVLANATKCLFVSQRNLETATRQLAFSLPNAAVIDNPINLSILSIKSYPSSPRLLMACVARLECDFKGQDILLQALSHEQWQHRDYQLNLYGAGPHYEHLIRLIEMYGLIDKVNLVGHVSNIEELWEKNQVLILPSLSEGTPLALIEAMLSGRTALVTNVGGNNCYITKETGFLASTASVDCLLESLEQLWVKRGMLKQMGVNAFHHAKNITNLKPEVELLNYVVS